MARKRSTEKQSKAIASTQSLSAFVKNICDVMRRSNCASALQYVPELTWILFLRILDAQEAKAREEAALTLKAQQKVIYAEASAKQVLVAYLSLTARTPRSRNA